MECAHSMNTASHLLMTEAGGLETMRMMERL